MKRIFRTGLFIFAISFFHTSFSAMAIPPPVLDSAKVDILVRRDTGTGFYEFKYRITNPSTNTAKLISAQVDITREQAGARYSEDEVTVSYGRLTKTFGELVSSRTNPVQMIPVGIQTPRGWFGSIGAKGFAAFNCVGTGHEILPGASSPEFIVTSRGLPVIRQMTLVPAWIYTSTTIGGITEEESREARRLTDAIRYTTKTIGPGGAVAGSFSHWVRLKKDLAESRDLGWLKDIGLYRKISALVDEAHNLNTNTEWARSRESLDRVLSVLNSAGEDEIASSSLDMIRLNIEALIATIPESRRSKADPEAKGLE